MTRHGSSVVLLMFMVWLGAPVAVNSQTLPTPTPTSTPVGCAQPNLAGTVIHAALPEVPPMAQQQGIGGTVQVQVSLDAFSHVLAVKIYSSPSALLNNAALRAARESTFQTEVVNCRPVASDYLFAVTFASAGVSRPLPQPTSTAVARFGTSTAPTVVVDAHEMHVIVPTEALVLVFVSSNTDRGPIVAALERAGIPDAQITVAPVSATSIASVGRVTSTLVARVPGAKIEAIRRAFLTVGSGPMSVQTAGVDEETTRRATSAATERAEAAAREFATAHAAKLGEVASVELALPRLSIIGDDVWLVQDVTVTYAVEGGR